MHERPLVCECESRANEFLNLPKLKYECMLASKIESFVERKITTRYFDNYKLNDDVLNLIL